MPKILKIKIILESINDHKNEIFDLKMSVPLVWSSYYTILGPGLELLSIFQNPGLKLLIKFVEKIQALNGRKAHFSYFKHLSLFFRFARLLFNLCQRYFLLCWGKKLLWAFQGLGLLSKLLKQKCVAALHSRVSGRDYSNRGQAPKDGYIRFRQLYC